MQQVFLFIWGPFYQRLLESAKNKKFKSAVQAKLCSNYCQLLPCDEWFRRIFFVIKSVKQSSCILFVLWLRSLFLSYHSVALEFIHLEYTLHSIYSSNGASPILQYSILLHGMHEEAITDLPHLQLVTTREEIHPPTAKCIMQQHQATCLHSWRWRC